MSKKKIDIEEDMSQTFISEVGQKSAIADDDFDDIKEEIKEKVSDDKDSSIDEIRKEEKMNEDIIKPKQKSFSVLTIILVVIALIVGFIVSYIIFDINSKKEEISTKKTEVKEKVEKNKVEYNPEGLFIQNLISDYDYASPSSNTNIYEMLYDKEKTTIDNIDNGYLRVLAANKAAGIRDVFNDLEFTNAVILLYGDSVTFKNNDITYSDLCVNISYDDNLYEYKQGECGGVSKLSMERKIVKASVTNDTSLEVYVAVAIVDLDNDKVYKNYSEDEEKLKEVKNVAASTFDIDKDYSKLNQYKYTFKFDKNNNNYYLVSIELAS